MSHTIEYFFDVGSPASYLAWTQLPGLAERHDARLTYKPMLLGGVFQATGNSSPVNVPAKSRYMRMDFLRHAQGYGVTFQFNDHFPINTLLLMRGAVAMLDTPEFDGYLRAVFNAIWVDNRNMGDPVVVGEVLQAAGMDPQSLLARCNDPAVKEQLKALTEEAVERGVFGAPTLFVNGDMHFGQDRLLLIEHQLREG